MVFDIKMKDFHRKICLVVRGHMVHTLNAIAYSRVVTRETVHDALTMAVLHDLEVKAAEILNTYGVSSNREKI